MQRFGSLLPEKVERAIFFNSKEGKMSNSEKWIGSSRFVERLQLIRAVVTDVDGVLSDGRIYLHSDGTESKAFHVRDRIGAMMLQTAGYELAMLTGRLNSVVEQRAAELGVTRLIGKPYNQKREGFLEYLEHTQLSGEQVLFVGDDVIDIPVFKLAGITVSPPDADPLTLQSADAVTIARAGHGVLREVVEQLLRAQGKWDFVLHSLFGLDKDSHTNA
jgi:3-deoxy-D-manno-octulosonate 8-phosphate phosphatase (KDO 8-P phosphatase)